MSYKSSSVSQTQKNKNGPEFAEFFLITDLTRQKMFIKWVLSWSWPKYIFQKLKCFAKNA